MLDFGDRYGNHRDIEPVEQDHPAEDEERYPKARRPMQRVVLTGRKGSAICPPIARGQAN
ncbi:hypothetical protein [Ensifer canadensis]